MAASSVSPSLQPPVSVCSTPKLYRQFTPGRPLQKETKVVILNVYAKLREGPLTISAVISETSRLTGVSCSTVVRLKAECKKYNNPRSPVRRSLDVSRKKPRRNYLSKLDDFDAEAIRRKVHHFFFENRIPTVRQVLEVVNKDDSLPSFSLMTLFRILKGLNFNFRRNKRNSALLTRPELISWRSQYLHALRQHREAKRPIYFIDETWVNVGHTKSKLWHDDTVKTSQQAQASGLSVGLTVPSGKGSRIIITHAGNEDGFVDGALDIFEGKKGKADYHQEMDGPRFQTWFVEKLLPNIKPKSVIVMDNASYHSVHVERLPTSKSKKAEIQQWLTDKGIEWTPDMLVKDLLQLVSSIRDQYTEFRIDKVAESAGHTVLRLPPYRCELNPIELIWSQVKGYIAAKNRKFQIGELRTLLQDSLARITPELWKSCVDHVVNKVEQTFWAQDGLVTRTMEPFIITCDGDSETSSGDDSDNDAEDLGVSPL